MTEKDTIISDYTDDLSSYLWDSLARVYDEGYHEGFKEGYDSVQTPLKETTKYKRFISSKTVPWDQPITNVNGVYLIPSGRIHDSGYMIMEMLFYLNDGSYIREEGCCDVIETNGKNFRIDCTSEGIFHIFNNKGFDVGHRLSSVEFIERGNNTNV